MRLRELTAIFVLALPATPTTLYVKTPMRDGVKLAANVFLPDSSGRFPTLLVRTPYDKGTYLLSSYRTFIDHNYAVVVQDVRGRYASEGTYRTFSQESNDGDDTLNWIAKQSWSNGKVGMVGGVLSRHRAVAGGVDAKPASNRHLSCRRRIRRVSRQFLLPRRCCEVGPPSALDL